MLGSSSATGPAQVRARNARRRNKIENRGGRVNRPPSNKIRGISIPRVPITPLLLCGLAFGVVEAGLAAALRSWLDPDGTAFPFVALPARILIIERWREGATLVVLASVACVAMRGGAGRFAAFLFVFGVWDLAYYAALVPFLGWPRSLGDWDLLFLLPCRWLAPVWAPLATAALMTACGGAVLRHIARWGGFVVRRRHVAAAAVGGVCVVASFVRPGNESAETPLEFAIWIWSAGCASGLLGFADAWAFNRREVVSSIAGATTSIARAPGESRPRAGG